MAFDVEVGLRPRRIVLDGDPALLPQKGDRAPSNFRPIFGRPFVKRFALCYRSVVCPVMSVLSVTFVHCGQTVGDMKMKVGMQVGLGPGHIMLDGNPAPPPQRGTAPNFRPISVAAKWLHGSRCHWVWS